MRKVVFDRDAGKTITTVFVSRDFVTKKKYKDRHLSRQQIEFRTCNELAAKLRGAK